MKILFVTTISNTINAFLIPHIKMLVDKGHQVDVAFNIEQEIKSDIFDMKCKIHILDFQRSPLDIRNIRAYSKLKEIIILEKYDLVHTHTPIASVCVRLACKNLINVKVFYTAHGFHFYENAPIINWVLYYPIEKLLSRFTDLIITINNEDYKRAKKSFKSKNIVYCPGVGLNSKKISETTIDKSVKRAELDLPNNAFVLLSVGELNKNKNHEIVIKSIFKLCNPDIYYIICGDGPLKGHLLSLIKKLKLENNVKLLGYRNDIPEICKASDIFIFPSIREGLGLAALEAMACGLPLISSNVHGIVDYSFDGITGYTNNPNSEIGFSESIKKLYSNTEIRIKFGQSNINIAKRFDTQVVMDKLDEIYVKYL